MGAELGVKGGVLGNERVGVEKDGGGHRASIYCCTAGKESGERAPGKQEGMLQPNLDPQPALVTVCLALGVCPPPVFPQQGQGSGKPFSTQGGISMLPPPPRLLLPSKDAGSSFSPILILHFFLLLPPFFLPPSLLPFSLLPLPPFSFALISSIHSVSGTHFCDSAQPSEPRKDHTAQCLETLHTVESLLLTLPQPHHLGLQMTAIEHLT